MKTISLRLPESLDNRLTAVARQRGQTRSALAREALKTFFENGGATQTPSCHDLAADLAGCSQGPGDLASNKKHMEGYGE